MIDLIMDHYIFFMILLISIVISGLILLASSPEYEKLMEINIKDLNFGHLFFLVIIHAGLINLRRKQ